MIDAERSDLFDVLAYIAFALAPITREERAQARRPGILARHDARLQAFLDFVLAQYVREGSGELDESKLPDLIELKYHSMAEAAVQLGGTAQIRAAFIDFQRDLYR